MRLQTVNQETDMETDVERQVACTRVESNSTGETKKTKNMVNNVGQTNGKPGVDEKGHNRE